MSIINLTSTTVSHLSDVQLLSTVLGHEVTSRPKSLAAVCGLDAAGGVSDRPPEMAGRIDEIARFKLDCARELFARAMSERLSENRQAFFQPASIKAFFQLRLSGKAREVFCVMFLDSQNRMMVCEDMFSGTLTQTSVYPREVVKRALEHNAASVVLAHNHPSGSVQPSRADESLTHNLKSCLALVDVRVLDHIIVGEGAALSMAEQGLM